MANGARLLGAGVLACGLLAGCVADVDASGRRQLEACHDAYGRGDDEAAIKHASGFLRNNSPSVRDDEAYYMRGLALWRQGDGVDARADLTRAAGSDRPAVRIRALLALGDMSLSGGDLAGAESFYRRCVRAGTKRRPPVQHAYLRLAHVLQRTGRWADADVQYSRVIHYFKRTRYARWAAARMHGRAWTIRAGAFARKQGAVDAAAGMVKAKLPATVEAQMRDGKLMHVVCVGRYRDYGQAEDALDQVRRACEGAYIGVAK